MAGKRTATVGGLTFSTEGAVAAAGYTLWMDDLDGWDDGAGVRRDRAARLFAHGEFSERGWREARVVTLAGDASCPSEAVAAVAAQDLAALLGDGLDGTLAVTDTATVPMSAGASLFVAPKVDWKNDTTVVFQFQFLCADPRRYGAAVTDSTGVATAGGALAYPLYSPDPPGVLDYGAAGDPGTLTLTNPGTADTAPAFTATGGMPNGFTITHVESGGRLIYAAEVLAGQSLRLDAADSSVVLEGYVDRSTYLTTRQWVRLAPKSTGTWLFEATGSTGALLTAEARPAWW